MTTVRTDFFKLGASMRKPPNSTMTLLSGPSALISPTRKNDGAARPE